MILANATDRPAPEAGPRERRKSVLFCPTCGNEHAPEDGIVTTHPEGVDIYCPDCLSFLARHGR